MEKNPVCVEKNPVKMEKNFAWIPYSGIPLNPFLADVLAVPFFAEEACGMGAHFTARDATIFSRIKIMPPSNSER